MYRREDHRERERHEKWGEKTLPNPITKTQVPHFCFVLPLTENEDFCVIRTCAEADTNERIHDYLENTLWGIRGLMAMRSICNGYGVDTEKYRVAEAALSESVKRICCKYALDNIDGEENK